MSGSLHPHPPWIAPSTSTRWPSDSSTPSHCAARHDLRLDRDRHAATVRAAGAEVADQLGHRDPGRHLALGAVHDDLHRATPAA